MTSDSITAGTDRPCPVCGQMFTTYPPQNPDRKHCSYLCFLKRDRTPK